MAKLDPTFSAFTITSSDAWRTPDFNPNAKEATRDYNKAVQDSFKAFGVYAKENVNNYLNKLSTPEGMLEEIIGGSGLSGVGGVLGTFIGDMSPLFKKGNAYQAKLLKEMGAGKDFIWSDTGSRIWNSGIRQEISDDTMTWGKNFDLAPIGNKLKDIVDHPEVFKAYPHLEKLDVVIDPRLKSGQGGISLDNKKITISEVDARARNKEGLETLLHEIQHSIQLKQGWQSGNNPQRIIKEMEKAYNRPLTEMEKQKAFKKYLTTPGEVEAENTVARMLMTPEERRAVIPDITAPFPISEMIKDHLNKFGVFK